MSRTSRDTTDEGPPGPSASASPGPTAAGGYQPADEAEAAFLAGYDAGAYERPSVTVDVVVLTIRGGQLCVLLVQRADHPYKGCWALPGGFLEPQEDADAGARRELLEETGTSGHLEQLRHYSDPDRDPRTRVISLAYLALLPAAGEPTAGSDAEAARFWPVADLPDAGVRLAFDHARILADGIERAASKLEYTTIATEFCGPTFTIGELRRVYEAVWGEPVDNGNFRRKVAGTPGFVATVDAPRVQGPKGPPAALYRSGGAAWLLPPLMRATLRRTIRAEEGTS